MLRSISPAASSRAAPPSAADLAAAHQPRPSSAPPQPVAAPPSPPPAALGENDEAAPELHWRALFTPHPDPAYREEQARGDGVRARILTLYCALVYPAFALLDWIAYPEHLSGFLLLRGLITAAALGVLWASARSTHAADLARALGVVTTLSVVGMCAASEGFRSNYVVGVIICFLAISTLELYRPRLLVRVLGGSFVAYTLANVARQDHAARDLVSSTFFLLGSLLFCVIAALLLEHGRRELFRARAELLRQNAALEAAQAQQRELLRTITHELRTPINSVLGFIELIELQDGGLAQSSRQRLQRMTVTSRRLLAVVNEILDLSQLEAGKLQLAAEGCKLPELLEEVAEELRGLVKSRPVRVEVECPAGLTLRVDPLRLRQVLINLASHAAKLTPEGVIALRARPDGPKHVCIEVVDSGDGIREEDKAALLQPLARTRDSRVSGAHGLGLSIARRLTELMGGSLSFVSEHGRGTTFEVRLPRAVSQAPEREP